MLGNSLFTKSKKKKNANALAKFLASQLKVKLTDEEIETCLCSLMKMKAEELQEIIDFCTMLKKQKAKSHV